MLKTCFNFDTIVLFEPSNADKSHRGVKPRKARRPETTSNRTRDPTMKVILGPTIGQASGRLGSSVYSHNRGGAYIRNGSIPVTSTTPAALAAKARLTTVSQNWQTLTEAERLAWDQFALQNPRNDRLRQTVTLTGHAAYVSLQTRRLLAAQGFLASPPIDPAPNGLLTLTGTFDIGAGAFAIAYTATPLGAGVQLWLRAAVYESQGINYVQNLLRFVGRSASAQASPFDSQTLIEAVFGALTVGQRVTIMVSTYDTATGLLSSPMRVDGTVIST